MIILTMSEELVVVHGPLYTVHVNTFSPTASPSTVAFGLLGSITVPLPAVNDHIPEAGKMGVVADKTVELIGVQNS